MQLVRNVFFTFMAHPIRSIEVAILTWIPVLVFLFAFPYFLQITPVWICAYYSIAFRANIRIMAKPYQTLIENFVADYEEKNGEIILDNESE